MSSAKESGVHIGGRRYTTRQIVAGVIIVLALIVVLQNTRTAHFDFLFFDFDAPVWVWMITLFGAGVATGLLLASRRAKHKASHTAGAGGTTNAT